MRDQEIIGLWEAYTSIYAPQEVEALDEDANYDRNRRRAAQRAAARNEARARGQTGNVPGVGYVSPRRERETYTDSAGVERHKTGARMPKKEDQKEGFETNLFDYILEHLVAEGYADTNQAALAIMANMSEEWRQSIVEQSAIGARAAKVVDDQRQGYLGDMDAINKLQDATSKSMGRLKKSQGPVVTPGLPGV